MAKKLNITKADRKAGGTANGGHPSGGGGFGRRIIDRLEAFDAALDGSGELERYTLRKVKLDLEPPTFDAAAVRRVRETLGVSQAVLAQLLGASVESVQSWETGRRVPNGIASRFLDEMAHDPEHWRRPAARGGGGLIGRAAGEAAGRRAGVRCRGDQMSSR